MIDNNTKPLIEQQNPTKYRDEVISDVHERERGVASYRAGLVELITGIDPTHFATLTFKNMYKKKDGSVVYLKKDKKSIIEELDRFFRNFHNGIFGSKSNRVIDNRIVLEHHSDDKIHAHFVIRWERQTERLVHHWNKNINKMLSIESDGHCLIEIGSQRVLSGKNSRKQNYDPEWAQGLAGEQLFRGHQVAVAGYMIKEHRQVLTGHYESIDVLEATKNGVQAPIW